MENSVLMTILAISILHTGQVIAKSNPAVVTIDGKARFQKLNSVSSTAKPETQYHFQNIQPESQQSHFAQNSAAIPHQQVVLHPLHIQRPLVHQVGVPVHNQLHPQSQQQILQLIQKVLYNTQQSNQPTAMIIIAQPAYVQPNVAQYGGTTQQLLNYFHNNPQARYQFVHGTPQAQPVTQYIQQSQPQAQALEASHPIASYPVLPAPAQYQAKILPVPMSQTTHMSPVHSAESYAQHSPIQHLAQLAAQQYYQQSHIQHHQPQPQGQPEYQLESRQNEADVDYPNSLPPIITGFENFSPEQQEKIKAQLSVHFGAPLQPFSVGQNQGKDNKKYQSLNTNEFVPSPELKTERTRNNIMSINKNTVTKM